MKEHKPYYQIGTQTGRGELNLAWYAQKYEINGVNYDFLLCSKVETETDEESGETTIRSPYRQVVVSYLNRSGSGNYGKTPTDAAWAHLHGICESLKKNLTYGYVRGKLTEALEEFQQRTYKEQALVIKEAQEKIAAALIIRTEITPYKG